MAERKPSSVQEFLAGLESGEIVEVLAPRGSVFQYSEAAGGDHFFAAKTGPGPLQISFRTGYAQLHDTSAGVLVWGFNEGPAEEFVQAIRQVGRFLLRGVRHVGVGLVLERLGVKLGPARAVVEAAADITESELVQFVLRAYGPEYIARAVGKISQATDPDSPGGRAVTDDELRLMLDEAGRPEVPEIVPEGQPGTTVLEEPEEEDSGTVKLAKPEDAEPEG